MSAPPLTPGKDRFVLLSQQTFTLAVVGAMALSAVGVVELEIVAPRGEGAAATAPASLVSTAPVTPTVRTVPLGGLSAQVGGRRDNDHPAAGEDGPQRISAISAPEPASGYATVGVTWTPGVALSEEDISVSVRTRTAGAWSPWQEMHYDPEHQPDPGTAEAESAAVTGTDAVVVGDVDTVQVKAATISGAAPEGLALAIVDPGRDVAPTYEQPAIGAEDKPLSGASAAEGGDPAASLSAATTATTAAAMETTKPTIYSRAQWGANESLRSGSPSYGDVSAGFVHHTVNANDYDQQQVPSILRGIYAYHTQSLGWSDVGYNFLVDRFGRIWEGRYGGVDRPVIGAHTLGYNEDSFAMSAIGNFEVATPSRAMTEAYARLFAWKLALHGIRADDPSQSVNGRTFPAVNGHRDAGSTACPGRYLYEHIPGIRQRAARLQQQRPAAAWDRDVDLSGGPWPDLIARDEVTRHALLVRTGGLLGFDKSVVAERDVLSADLVVAPGDLDGDRTADVLVRDAGTGSTTLYAGDGAGGLHATDRSFTRFAGADQLTGVGDFDGDSEPDLVGRRDGALLLWPGTEGGGFGDARTLAQDWSAYDLTAGVGDFDGDDDPDLVARSGESLVLVRGTGRGLEAPVPLPGRWRGDLVAGRGDASGDGHPDLVVREAGTGLTFIQPGDGAGGLQPRIGGWERFSSARWLGLGGRLSEGRRPDLLGWNATKGVLRVFPNSGRRNLGQTVDTGISLDSADLVLNVGDWDGDGRGDVLTRQVGGALSLHAGQGRDRFAAARALPADWSGVRQVVAAGDMTGDGSPDLMGQGSAGDVRVYPNDGRGGFDASYVEHTGLDRDRLVGVGLFDGDAAPDTVVRRADGTLWLWGRTGPDQQVGTGGRRYDWVRTYGDVDGDGLSDVVARSRRDGRLWLLAGATTGFADRRLVGDGFDAYDLLG